MIGVGIFIYPPVVAQLVSEPTTFLLMWAFGGLTALAGAAAYAELGAALPRAGGDYVFIREAFGDSMAFACGWVAFTGGFCGSLATLAVAIAQFQVPVLTGIDTGAIAFEWPWGASATVAQVIGVVIVMLFTELNVVGLRLSAWTQTITTVLPFVLLTVLAVCALAMDVEVPAVTAHHAPTAKAGGLSAFVDAYLAVYFAYAGWNAIVYVAGEVRAPHRTIPLSLVGGTVAVSLLYLLLCGTFLSVFGLDGLAQTSEAGSALAKAMGGRGLEVAMVALIAAGIVSSINATVMGGGRIAFAMARAGAFWSGAGVLDTVRSLPVRALRIQGFVTLALVATGTFDQIFKLATIAMVVVGSLTVGALFVLRHRRPEMDRPYRALGYPWLPGLYLVASTLVVGVMIAQAIADGGESAYAIAGLGVLGVAYAGHRFTKRVISK